MNTSKLTGEEKAKYIEATKKAVSNGSKYLDEKIYRDVCDLIPDLAKSLEERGLDSQSISPVIGRDVFTKTPLTNSPSHGANKSTTLPSGNFTNSRSDIRNSSIDNIINISQNVNNNEISERTKAYRKVEETYQSNQQLPKAAAPNRKVNLNAATDYANAEVKA